MTDGADHEALVADAGRDLPAGDQPDELARGGDAARSRRHLLGRGGDGLAEQLHQGGLAPGEVA